jgi:hypothetical protein
MDLVLKRIIDLIRNVEVVVMYSKALLLCVSVYISYIRFLFFSGSDQ